ncbi:MAG: M15 family metallopeptidase [Clostridiales bacterium]|nr:M15 family metallopeptidase [Clostridiales bacterium]
MRNKKTKDIITIVFCAFALLIIAALSVVLYRVSKNEGVSETEHTTTTTTTTTQIYTTTEPETTTTTTTTQKETQATTKKVTTTAAEHTTVSHKAGEPVIETRNGVTYVNGILVVNKTYSIPSSYGNGIDPQAAAAFNKLVAAAKKDGYSIYSISDYRPYSSQQRIYNGYVNREGKAGADRHSARPGHSEHQTGLAYDVNSLDQNFGKTAEGRWIANNCYKYGFILRYPKGKESITGYMYEPWHIRYLGVENAKKVYDTGLTLEEYLGITSEYQD